MKYNNGKAGKTDTQKRDTGRILYISDLHLFHDRMIELCNRPFNDAAEMNQAIIDNWKTKVCSNDTVYILGDVGMYHAKEIADIMNALPGKKILITGNHDKRNLKNAEFRRAFCKIKPYDEIWDKNRKVVLFHYPIEEWDGYFRDFYHLFGHVHNKDSQIQFHIQKFNVSADVIGFEPKTLDELIEIKDKNKGISILAEFGDRFW